LRGPQDRRFVIVSLARSGSTTLVHFLNRHRDIRCLIEPFGAHNHGGRFHRLATQENGFDRTLDLIWDRWNAIKYIWDPGGHPFVGRPELQARIFSVPGVRFLALERRNLLRRWLSHYISTKLDHWQGPREEFHDLVRGSVFRALRPEIVRQRIEADRAALARQREALAGRDVMTVVYEDFYRDDASAEDRFAYGNRILSFLGFAPLSHEEFGKGLSRLLETRNRWGSTEVYRRIPEIEELEAECGSDETGWLFR
jgi:hypothetical protein